MKLYLPKFEKSMKIDGILNNETHMSIFDIVSVHCREENEGGGESDRVVRVRATILSFTKKLLLRAVTIDKHCILLYSIFFICL